jgi:glycosyltransferase involved in cell wall biosynthesis
MFEALIEGARFEVIGNGIDPKDYLDLSTRAVGIAEEWDWGRRGLVMVQPVRLVRHKNLELSLDITAALRDRGVNPLLLAPTVYDVLDPASRSYRDRLETSLEALDLFDHVALLVQSPDEVANQKEARRLVRELYLMADMLLMTSRDEGFGLTLLEAGLLKLPIVASRIPAFEEVAGDQALFFDLDEPPDGIADRMLDFASNSAAGAMFRRVREKFDWDAVYEQRLGPFLESLVGEGEP